MGTATARSGENTNRIRRHITDESSWLLRHERHCTIRGPPRPKTDGCTGIANLPVPGVDASALDTHVAQGSECARRAHQTRSGVPCNRRKCNSSKCNSSKCNSRKNAEELTGCEGHPVDCASAIRQFLLRPLSCSAFFRLLQLAVLRSAVQAVIIAVPGCAVQPVALTVYFFGSRMSSIRLIAPWMCS